MGNYANKLLFYTNESQKERNENQMVVQQATMEDNNICTPILSEKRVLDDPRSVSAGIRRTPIEIKCTSSEENKKTPSAMLKYLQKKQYLETDMYFAMPPLTPKKLISKSMDSNKQSDFIEVQDLTPNVNVAKSSKIITPLDKERFIILGLDPRSPAADFDRTPILMPKSLALIKARSQENLSHKGSYEVDIYNLKNSCQKIDTAINIPETRLSDTASESLKALDTEEQDGVSSTSLYSSDLNTSKSEKEITVIRNPKYISEERRSLVSDKQIVAIDNEDKIETEKQDDCENIESNTKTRDDDKIKLWHDSLSSEKSVSGKDEKELSRKKIARDDVIITFDKYTTISTSLKPMKTDFRKKGDTKGKKKNTKVNVKLNEEKFFTPENKQEIEMYENRIPLGNRSNNNQIQKKPQQLLKNKTASIGTQENTPPSKTYSRKTRNGTQWDPNSTVLI
ncbi:PREDICTED: uncharacterized protein LOC108761701 isoform X1 [Trachymyrmex cornetzi]|uniref:uncharacterized protein LOC108761701 isoform X1 n=1 Tax=Trachymyrmex cornetzi TaxID=471704 RepID=UPI00084EE582|nr:PREDICTED: uncharacterized protein LOC108761701 isoform X1 [Trachymyrmex cornetzi]XP_018363887.1 PREDICTED: uncharacterized protein LOC108761701 isoform X1 [Trachymyrmex cornetzi]